MLISGVFLALKKCISLSFVKNKLVHRGVWLFYFVLDELCATEALSTAITSERRAAGTALINIHARAGGRMDTFDSPGSELPDA